jgi:hypothetical protein
MPYDPELADRIRDHVADMPLLTEKKMFGGIGWMSGGHMACGAHNDQRLMIRCAREDWADFIAEPGAEGFTHGGKQMTGWVLVDQDAVATDADLRKWLDRGCDFAASQPPKPPKKPKAKKARAKPKA